VDIQKVLKQLELLKAYYGDGVNGQVIRYETGSLLRLKDGKQEWRPADETKWRPFGATMPWAEQIDTKYSAHFDLHTSEDEYRLAETLVARAQPRTKIEIRCQVVEYPDHFDTALDAEAAGSLEVEVLSSWSLDEESLGDDFEDDGEPYETLATCAMRDAANKLTKKGR
jgi:hypothetical protein